MVKINVAIKTADRSPRRNFLGETLRNLARAGVLDSPHLGFITVVNSVADERWLRSHVPLSLWPGVDSANRTLHQNAQRCIELASIGSIPEPGWAMVLEDDLDVCDDFLGQTVAWLEDRAVESPQMYVLGANYEQIERVAAAGGSAWAYPVNAFYGAQALVWRRKDAAQLAAWLGPNPSYNGITDHGHDLKLQAWGKEQGLMHFIASAPCLVQHVGGESSIGNRFFQFPWGGRDWRYGKVTV